MIANSGGPCRDTIQITAAATATVPVRVDEPVAVPDPRWDRGGVTVVFLAVARPGLRPHRPAAASRARRTGCRRTNATTPFTRTLFRLWFTSPPCSMAADSD